MSEKHIVQSNLELVLKDLLEQSHDLGETLQCTPESIGEYLDNRARQIEMGREFGEPAIKKISVGIEIAILLQLEHLLKGTRVNLEAFENKARRLEALKDEQS